MLERLHFIVGGLSRCPQLNCSVELGPVVVSYNRNNWNAGEPSGNWCLSPRTGRASVRGPGISPRTIFFEIVCAKFCNLMHFWPENGSQCRLQCILKHVNNGNAVHTRFRSKWPLVRTDGTWKGKALSRWSSVLCTMRLFKVAQEVHSMLLSALVLLDQIHCSR